MLDLAALAADGTGWVLLPWVGAIVALLAAVFVRPTGDHASTPSAFEPIDSRWPWLVGVTGFAVLVGRLSVRALDKDAYMDLPRLGSSFSHSLSLTAETSDALWRVWVFGLWPGSDGLRVLMLVAWAITVWASWRIASRSLTPSVAMLVLPFMVLDGRVFRPFSELRSLAPAQVVAALALVVWLRDPRRPKWAIALMAVAALDLWWAGLWLVAWALWLGRSHVGLLVSAAAMLTCSTLALAMAPGPGLALHPPVVDMERMALPLLVVFLHAVVPPLTGRMQTVRVPVQRMALLVLVALVAGPMQASDITTVARPLLLVWVIAALMIVPRWGLSVSLVVGLMFEPAVVAMGLAMFVKPRGVPWVAVLGFGVLAVGNGLTARVYRQTPKELAGVQQWVDRHLPNTPVFLNGGENTALYAAICGSFDPMAGQLAPWESGTGEACRGLAFGPGRCDQAGPFVYVDPWWGPGQHGLADRCAVDLGGVQCEPQHQVGRWDIFRCE